MKPQSRLLETYRRIVSESRLRVDGAIPALTGPTRPPQHPALKVIRNEWAAATTALDAINSVFDNISEALWTEYTNTDLNDQARNKRVQSVITQYRGAFDAQRQAADTSLTHILDTAAKACMPPRPQPEDALQEARIAGIKSDLTMLLASRIESNALVNEVDNYFTAALGRGDQLAVWVVAGSGWLDLYARSRGEDQHFVDAVTLSLDDVVSRRLDAQPSADPAVDLRQLNRVLVDPQRGVQSILTVLGGFATNVFNDLAEWAPLGPTGY